MKHLPRIQQIFLKGRLSILIVRVVTLGRSHRGNKPKPSPYYCSTWNTAVHYLTNMDKQTQLLSMFSVPVTKAQDREGTWLLSPSCETEAARTKTVLASWFSPPTISSSLALLHIHLSSLISYLDFHNHHIQLETETNKLIIVLLRAATKHLSKIR